MSSIALQLAAFVDGIRYERLPASTIRAVKTLIIDSLGCAIGALDAEPVRLISAIVPEIAASGPGATLFGQDRRSTAEGATIFNGTLLRYLDFMDVYWSKDPCHPSENIPAAFACVEEAGGSGKDLIEAVLTGFEVQLRLCNAFSFEKLGFHHGSAAGFVVPLIAGKAWRQPVPVMAHGSVLGGVRHMTLLSLSRGHLSMAKAIGYSMNAGESLTAARLAGYGMTGPMAAYEQLFKLAPPDDPSVLTLDHDQFVIERVSLKQYPVQFNLQAPVVAAIRLHHELQGRCGEIERIVVMVKHESLRRTAEPEKFHPKDRETADHSLPACVAMGLLDGRLTPDQFDANRFLDQDVIGLMAKTEAMIGPDFEERFPRGRPGAVYVTLKDGSVHKAEEERAYGDPERPFDDAALHEKFLNLVEPRLGRDRAWRIIEYVNTLESLPDVAPLMAELAGG